MNHKCQVGSIARDPPPSPSRFLPNFSLFFNSPQQLQSLDRAVFAMIFPSLSVPYTFSFSTPTAAACTAVCHAVLGIHSFKSAVEAVSMNIDDFFHGQAFQLVIERLRLSLDPVEDWQLLQSRIERHLLGLDVPADRAAFTVRKMLAIKLMAGWKLGRLPASLHRCLDIRIFPFAFGRRRWRCCEDLSILEFFLRLIAELVVLLTWTSSVLVAIEIMFGGGLPDSRWSEPTP